MFWRYRGKFALLFCGLCACTPEKKVPTPLREVAIIGAGISGLSAALDLQKAGISFSLFETSHRAGGRIFSAHNLFNTKLVSNRGAEFVDSSHTQLLSLMQELGIELDSAIPPRELIDESYFLDEKLISKQDALDFFSREYSEIFKTFERDCIRFVRERAAAGNDYSDYERELDHISATDYLDSIGDHADSTLRRFLAQSVKNETGADLEKLSALLFFSDFRVHDGKLLFMPDNDEAFRIRGGSEKIIDALVARVGDRIVYKHRLTKLQQDNEGIYLLSFDTPNGPRQERAKHVVLTLPPFKFKDIEIDVPGFDRELRETFGRTTYSQHTKLTFFFSRRLWLEQGHSGSINNRQIFDSSALQEGEAGSLTFYLGYLVRPEDRDREATQALALLEKLFPGIGAHYRGRRFFSWSHSYSGAAAPPNETTNTPRIPEPLKNLHFSGEYFGMNQGYMDGAVESAQRAAREIVSLCEAAAQPRL